MYVEKRKSKDGKIKYFLSHSFREGNKVQKVRKLLGSNLDENKLKERIQKAEQLILEEIEKYKIIQDPLQNELSKEEIDFVRRLEAEANLKIIHLSEAEWKVFSELFTYNTNAIEGSKLTSGEVKEIIGKDKWPKEKSKDDIAETYGVNEAVGFIRKTKDSLSLELIKELHKIVFKNSKDFAGEFRTRGQDVVVRDGMGNILHEGAPQPRVISLLKELIKWYDLNKNKYPALILAAVVHNQFETIHPFADGNGRIGRLLLNNTLIKHGLPPVNIDIKNRAEYYKVLQDYQKRHNLRPTIEFILKEYKNLKKALKK